MSPTSQTDANLPPALDNPKLSIAVLPFTNLSGDPDQDYSADAVTEDLTVDLSRRTAASYRGQDIDSRQVARELGVRYLLEGTLRCGQGDVRVNATDRR